MSRPALIVIDMQNDYFQGGAFPQWNSEATLEAVGNAIASARTRNIPVILVQHVSDPAQGIAPFFNHGNEGVEIHPRIRTAAPDAPIVIKRFADSFEQTDLKAGLQGLGIDELILCGIMTQNCVTHTALSRAADDYEKVTVLTDACTSVNEMIHGIALHALSTRVTLAPTQGAI